MVPGTAVAVIFVRIEEEVNRGDSSPKLENRENKENKEAHAVDKGVVTVNTDPSKHRRSFEVGENEIAGR